MDFGTGIALAFARNPMNIAVAAQDLNIYSGGRFRLGLGAQITDEMLDTFAAVGEPADAARIVRKRVGGVADSVFLDVKRSPDVLATQMEILRG